MLRSFVLAAGFILTAVRVHAADDLVVGDFSGTTYAPWKAEGAAFSKGPVHDAALLKKLEEENTQGFGVATSEIDGDGPRGTLTSPAFRIERSCISFLVGGGMWQHNTCVNLIVDGRVVKSATGTNSDQLAPTSWDVTPWRERMATIQLIDDASGNWGHIIVAHVIQTDKPPRPPVSAGPLYDEIFRPQFHFSARQWTVDKLNPGMREEGWMNDPNGLVYYDHEYHLFSQRWNKCWIHAVSPDLVHWTELEPAFWEPQLDSGVQSGTCVIDYGNTSGLSPDNARPAMVAFWATADNKTQNISYSLDHGRTWKIYDKNPVLNSPERDPKVFRYEPTKSWVMFLYDNQAYHIFTSKNLLDWTDTHNTTPNSWECPDVFQLPIDGDKRKMKWVLMRGNGHYSLGTFDGTKFTEETPQYPSDSGPHFYATQTWNNMETGDGRRIQLTWMAVGAYPGMPFSQQMDFPRELSLRSTPDGPRIFREPVREIALLQQSENDWTDRTLTDGSELKLIPDGQLFQIQAEVRIPAGSTLTFHLRGTDLVATHQDIACGATGHVSGELTYLEILVDRSSIEAFANHGEASLSRVVLPHAEGLSITSKGEPVTIKSLKIFRLNSAWKPGKGIRI